MKKLIPIVVWSVVLHTANFVSIAWGQQAGSEDGVWERVDPQRSVVLADAPPDNRFRPRAFQLFHFNRDAFQRISGRTPKARSAGRAFDAVNSPVGPEMSIPMPQGHYLRFRLEEIDVMAPELAAKFPEIKSFRGIAEDGRTMMHADISPKGFHAQIMGADGVILVDPWDANDNHAAYFKKDARLERAPFNCQVLGRAADAPADAARTAATSGSLLRTYRLAIGCTRQYAAKHGTTKLLVLSAINTTINRVNMVYQRDLCVRLQLVANNDHIVFLGAADDPYTGNDNADVLINESQSVIDNKIGSGNYDIGHTFSTGAGGLAGLGVVCISGQKARGVTGSANPVGDPFDIDYVAHEMGHQFGGDHTFNGKIGSCSGGNRNASTAVEPGSGSTIQAYAGICGADDLQPNSDPYFHAVSLDQILTFVNSGAASAVTGIATGNSAPTVSAGNNCKIPKLTPFQLTATGSDPNSDPLTFCWEEMDVGPAANLGDLDGGANPLFRSFVPSSLPIRCFPQISTLLSGTTNRSENLPLKDRKLTFRVTARDNRIDGGGIRGAEVALNVIPAAGPFKVTSPSNGTQAGLIEVKWDVAQTNIAPIETKFVNILLSTDGGITFSTTLALNTPNDGQQLVALPSTSIAGARIKVEAVGNVFFSISDSFSVAPARSAIVFVRHAEKESDSGDPALTPAGLQRAISLNRELANCNVRDVRSTDTQRTRQTATPTAQAAGVGVDLYSDSEALCNQLANLTDGRTVLVVGHSNTVPEMLAKLKPGTTATIADNQFDQLFVIVRGADNQTTLIHRTYSIGTSAVSDTPLVAETVRARSSGDGDLQAQIQGLRKEIQELRDELRQSRAAR